MNGAGFLMILIAALLTAISNLSLRFGISQMGGFGLSAENLTKQIVSFVLQPACMAGVLMQALAAVVWFRILSIMEVSRGYPVLVSLTFLFVFLGSLLFFGEALSWRKLTGLAVIAGGIQLVARG